MLTFNGTAISATTMLVWLVIALISGAIAEALLGYSHIGLISATAVGLVGAMLGTWVAQLLHLPPLLTISLFGVQAELIWCTVGTVLLIIMLQTLRYRRGGGYRRRYRYPREY